MALNGSGVRNTVRVLKISKGTPISTLKKADAPVRVHPNFPPQWAQKPGLEVSLGRVEREAQRDEPWSYVGKKSNPRWLWYAVDHAGNPVLAYTFGRRQDDVFKELKDLLAPLSIGRYYTDDWGRLPTPSQDGRTPNGQTTHPKN